MPAYSENEKKVKVEVGRKIIAALRADAECMFGGNSFIKVYYDLVSPYKWKKGWTASSDDRIRMNNLLHEAVTSMGWEIHPAKYSSACDEGFSANGERLYLHPMEVAGEVKVETVKVAEAAFAEAAHKSNGMFRLGGIRAPYKVYELSEDDLHNFYSKHESDIRALVSNYFETMLWKQEVDADMFDLYKSFRIEERGNAGFVSNTEPQIKLFYAIRDKMVKEGLLRIDGYHIKWVG